MKKYFKIISYCLLAAFFSVALTGCGKKTAVDPNANKIIVWSFEDEDIWKPIAQDFASTFKGYSLVYQKQILDSNYENRLFNSTLSGSGPDVWSMPNDWVYRHKDKLAPMPDNLVKQINMDTQYVPVVKQSVVFDKKIYALTPTAETLSLFYNKNLISNRLDQIIEQAGDNSDYIAKANKLLGDPPLTWSDFVEASKLLTIKNGNDIQISGAALGTSKITSANDILYLLMLQNGTQIISSDFKTASFNLPADTATGRKDNPGIRAMDFYTSFANPTSANYCWNDNLGNDIEAFAQGKVAYLFGYSSLENVFLQKYPQIQYERAYMPQVTTDKNKVVDYGRFDAFGASKLSKNPAVAWGLIAMLSTDNISDFSSGTRTTSAQKQNSYDLSFENRSGNDPDPLQLATASTLIKGRFPVEFDAIMRASINAVNTNAQNPQAATDWAASKESDLLRREGW